MTLRNLIATALLCSVTNAFAMDAAGSFAVKGVGLSKCSAFVEVAKGQDQGALARYVGWIGGFVTASNQHLKDNFDITPWQNMRTLTLALVNHCDKNADMRFGEAVVRMTGSLYKDRLTSKSELIPIEHEGKQHYVYKESIRRTQAKLSELGLYSGDIDGDFNEATKTAIKTFQAERKLPETGMPDQNTVFQLLLK